MGQKNSWPEFTFQKLNDNDNSNILYYLGSKTHEKQYILREIVMKDKDSYSNIQKLIKKKKNLEHNNIAKLQNYFLKVNNQLCSSTYVLSIIYELPLKTLAVQREARYNSKNLYMNTQLEEILKSLVSAFSYLQKNQIQHRSVRSSNIYLDHFNKVKISDPFAKNTKSNFKLHFQNEDPFKEGIYLSPEQLKYLYEKEKFSQINPYKSDVFVCGIIMIELCTLRIQSNFYKCCKFVDETILKMKLEQIKSISTYGRSSIIHLLSLMLKINVRQRPDWIQIQSHYQNQQYKPNLQKIIKPQPNFTNSLKSKHMKTLSTFPFNQTLQKSTLNQTSSGALHFRNKSDVQLTNHQFYKKQSIINFPKPKIYQKIFQNTPKFVLQTMKISNPDVTLNRNIINFKYIVKTKIDENMCIGFFDNDQINQENSFDSSIGKVSIIIAKQELKKQNQISKKKKDLISDKIPVEKDLIFVKEIYNKGAAYEGFKQKGMRHGKGIFYYKDGGMYDGNWNNNKMEGFGKLYYTNGKLAYEGMWKEDYFQGQGKLYNQKIQTYSQEFDYKNFNNLGNKWKSYEGSFKHDLKQGKGKLLLSNNQIYQGYFLNDLVHGKGCFFNKKNQLIRGVWKQNYFLNTNQN